MIWREVVSFIRDCDFDLNDLDMNNLLYNDDKLFVLYIIEINFDNVYLVFLYILFYIKLKKFVYCRVD